MGAFADYLSSPDAGTPAPAEDESPGQFKQGLRSGLYGAGSQAAAAAGLGQEFFGYDPAAANQLSQELEAQAQANAPRVNSYKQVNDIRSGYDYVTGLLGQSVPQSALAIAGSLAAKTPLGRGLGATLATAPLEAGEIAQRQAEDPAIAQQDVSTRLGQAAVGGTLSAGVQSIVPAMVAGKLAGTAAKKGLRQALTEAATGFPETAAIEGGTEAAGELVKQGALMAANPERSIDTERLLEAGIGGAAAGAGMHAVGAAGDIAHASPGASVAALRDALPQGKEAPPAPTSASREIGPYTGGGEAQAAAAADLRSPIDSLRDIYDGGKKMASDFMERMARNEDVAGLVAKARGITDIDKIKDLLPEVDAERVARAKEWGEELLAKGGLTPERQKAVKDALANVTDQASQATIATFKRAQDATSDFTSKAKSFADSFAEDAKAKKAGTAKKSEDYSGIRKAIGEEVLPIVQRLYPNMDSDPKVLDQVADGLRRAIGVAEAGGRGAITSSQAARLIDIFGDEAVNVLDGVYRALGKAPGPETEQFYGALNEMRKQQRDRDKTLGLMQRSLNPELQDTVTMPQLRKELDALRGWVSQQGRETEQGRFLHQTVIADLETRYGSKAKDILAALEKEHEKASQDNIVNDAAEHALSEKESEHVFGDALYYGRKDDKGGREGMSLLPEHEADAKKNQITAALERATKENPSKTVSMLTAKDLGENHPLVQEQMKRLFNERAEAGMEPDAKEVAKEVMERYGIVAAEGSRDMPGRIDRTNVRKVMVGEKTSHRAQPTVFKAGGVNYDARALTKLMQEQAKDESSEHDKTAVHRSARMFMEGVAALQDHIGKPIHLADSLVIDRHGTTVADIRKLGFAPDTAVNEAVQRSIDKAKAEFKGKADEAHAELEGEALEKELGKLRTQLRNRLKNIRDASITFDPQSNAGIDTDGKHEIDPFNDEIHAVGDKGELHTNPDGSARTEASKTDRLTPENVKAINARIDALDAATKGAAGKKIIERARELVENLDVLPKAVHRTLLGVITAGKSPSAIAADINFLHDKYKGQFKSPATDAKKAASEVAASVGPKGVAESRQAIGTGSITPAERRAVRDYITSVLGPAVRTVFANFGHAGEFERVGATDVVRISVHALNPMGVAYHESLHGFFAKLMDQGNTKVGNTLKNVAMGDSVQAQLRRHLANEPAALAQLTDPEEAAAYMYQFWAAGQLTIGPNVKTIFHKIAEAIRKVLGIWSQDERAEKIMDYFKTGEFARNIGQPDAVAQALVESGKNETLEKARAMTQPLLKVAEALAVSGGQRMRDTAIPALRQLADKVQPTGRDARTGDPGFLPAARATRVRIMNHFASQLAGYTEGHVNDALTAMQTQSRAMTPEGRIIQRMVQDDMLPYMLDYLRDAGVKITGLTTEGAKYFPRKYDATYIANHQDEFKAVLTNRGITPKEAQRITEVLMASDGAEPLLEVDRPGMTNANHRVLGIPDVELAPFMSKNLFEILNSYVFQGTRRAEWARRFGDSNEKLKVMLDKAVDEGATAEHMTQVDKFLKSANGSLGDGLSPTARRLMGNVIVFENIRLLPLAIFSSVVDPLGIVVRGGTVSDAWTTFTRGAKELRHAWTQDYPTDGDTKMAETLGVIESSMIAHTTSALYTQGMVGEGAKKWNDRFFRWNFMEGFNRSMRVGATQAAIKFLERHADGTASDHSVRWLAELGLTPADLANGVDLTDHKVRAAINQWVDGAVLRPNAVDKPVWMNDPRFMLVSHLKQFAYQFQESILKRVVHEAAHGNYAPAMALASYVPVMIASDFLKGMIQGAGDVPEWKRKWGAADYLGAGVERAGLFGAGQFAIDTARDAHRGNFIPGSLTGPAIEHLADGLSALSGKARMSHFVEHSLPANTLYMGLLDKRSASADPTFVE